MTNLKSTKIVSNIWPRSVLWTLIKKCFTHFRFIFRKWTNVCCWPRENKQTGPLWNCHFKITDFTGTKWKSWTQIWILLFAREKWKIQFFHFTLITFDLSDLDENKLLLASREVHFKDSFPRWDSSQPTIDRSRMWDSIVGYSFASKLSKNQRAQNLLQLIKTVQTVQLSPRIDKQISLRGEKKNQSRPVGSCKIFITANWNYICVTFSQQEMVYTNYHGNARVFIELRVRGTHRGKSKRFGELHSSFSWTSHTTIPNP